MTDQSFSKRCPLPPLPEARQRKARFWQKQVQALLEHDSYSRVTWRFFAEVCKIFRLLDEMWQMAERAIAEDPEWSEGYAWKAVVLGMTDDDPEQMAAMTEEWLKRAPDDCKAWATAAMVARRRKDHIAERTCWERAIRLDPENHSLRIGLACALLTLGETNAALTTARSALACHPRSATAYGVVAECLNAQGEHVKALESAYEGVAIEADNYFCLLAAAKALEEVGKDNLARGVIEKLYALFPQDQQVCELRIAYNRDDVNPPDFT